MHVSGGNIGELSTGGSVYLFGGSVQTVNGFGGTLVVTGREFQLGDGLTMPGDRLLGNGYLSGEWLDGTPWTTYVWQWDQAETDIYLVPEPATLSLLALGGLALLKRRK